MVADLAVVGLGYVGLPLAQEAVRAGLTAIGFDVNQRVVDGLNAGSSHVDDLSDDDVQAMLRSGFRATTDESQIAQATVVVICVPTPLSEAGGPDLGAVRSATATVTRNLRPGMLVVLESTTYPGTTEEIIRPMLEAGGLVVGTDVHLAFSPERVDPGNAHFGIRNTPKVVGGCTPECTRRAAEFYGRFIETVVTARGTREAETAKLLENTYRHVNIALVNEMARFCHELDIDLWDAIDCAATKPFGYMAFRPGPGVGGHCIPVDPSYLSHRVKAQLGYAFRMVELAEEINTAAPMYVADRIWQALNDRRIAVNGAKVLLLGVTYKANISDQRESPADPLARRLMDWGADVSYHDPFVAEWEIKGANGIALKSKGDAVEAAGEADIVVLLQVHDTYDLPGLSASATCLLDTRGALADGQAIKL